MKLALIYPPFYHKVFNENLPTVDDEFGLFPHIGFGWVSAYAKQAGWDTALFDAAAEGFLFEECLQKVVQYNPDILGFAAHSAQTFQDMLEWAKKFRLATNIPILVGGYEAKVYAIEIMQHQCFDFLCYGEAVSFIPMFLQAFEKKTDYEKVPDLMYRKNNKVLRTFDAPYIPFKDLITPDRTIFKNHLYYSHVSQRRNFTIGMSEIGCPYPCSFCSMRQTGFEGRSAIQVVDEMELEYRLNNIREIDWFDPIMFHDRQRAIDISKEVQLRKLDMIWSTRSRVDSFTFHKQDGDLDTQLIEYLAEGGLKRVFLGLESGDDMVLKAMRKKQNTDIRRKVIDCLNEHGIRVLGFFMIGAPAETIQTAKKTIKFAKSLPIDYAQFSLTMIKPHTLLNKEFIQKNGNLDYWKQYILGNLPEVTLPTPWTTLTRAQQEKLARKGYFSFYFRPKYIYKMLVKIESWEEFFRYLRVATQLLLRPLKNIHLNILARMIRFCFTFMEGYIALKSNGARHLLNQYGKGFKAALAYTRAQTKVLIEKNFEDYAQELHATQILNNIEGNIEKGNYKSISKGSLGQGIKRVKPE